MMRRPFAIAGVVAALSLGAGPALAFQETPAPPPATATEAAPQAKAPALQVGNPNAPAAPSADSKGLKVFGYSILPKLDFGLELLYGQEQQQLDLQQGPTFDDNGDVTVLGKVKRRF
jgi:hypothetical protein